MKRAAVVMRGISIPILDYEFVKKVCPFPAGTEYYIYELKFTPPPDMCVLYWTHYKRNSDGTFTGLKGEYPPDGTREFEAEMTDWIHYELGITRSNYAKARFVLKNSLFHHLPAEMRRLIMRKMCNVKRIFMFYKV